MTTSVSFEIAKLLKEKGFDKVTNKSYRISVNPERPLPTEPIADEITYFPNVKESYLAPTIAEVVMWLYKTHKVWIEIKISFEGSFSPKISTNKMNAGWRIAQMLEFYPTPTAAYEAAIEYCLTKLI